MKIIDNILEKEQTKLTFKERQVVVDYFRHLVNREFEQFKKNYLKKDKEEIFEKAYIIDCYENIRMNLNSLSYFTIAKLLKYLKGDYISYMYDADVNDGIIDYYEDIENRILNEITKLRIHNEQKAA